MALPNDPLQYISTTDPVVGTADPNTPNGAINRELNKLLQNDRALDANDLIRVADEAARDLAQANYVGQELYQADNDTYWVAVSTMAGDFKRRHSSIQVIDDTNFAGITPSAAIKRHLEYVSDRIVKVGPAEYITERGEVTHEQVINAAVDALYSDNGSRTLRLGEVHLFPSTYLVSDGLLFPGRVNCVGTISKNGWFANTILLAQTGGLLSAGGASAWVLDFESLNGTANANFFQHTRNLLIQPEYICSGLRWGGAQSSNLHNIHVKRIITGGTCLRVTAGTNNAQVTDSQFWGISSGGPNPGTTRNGVVVETDVRVGFINVKPEQLSLGWNIANAAVTLLNCYHEACTLMMKKTLWGGYVFGSGVSLTNPDNGLGPGGEDLILMNEGVCHHVELSGELHSINEGFQRDVFYSYGSSGLPKHLYRVVNNFGSTGTSSSSETRPYSLSCLRPAGESNVVPTTPSPNTWVPWARPSTFTHFAAAGWDDNDGYVLTPISVGARGDAMPDGYTQEVINGHATNTVMMFPASYSGNPDEIEGAGGPGVAVAVGPGEHCYFIKVGHKLWRKITISS